MAVLLFMMHSSRLGPIDPYWLHINRLWVGSGSLTLVLAPQLDKCIMICIVCMKNYEVKTLVRLLHIPTFEEKVPTFSYFFPTCQKGSYFFLTFWKKVTWQPEQTVTTIFYYAKIFHSYPLKMFCQNSTIHLKIL
jgi:hypothetical protein